MALMVVSVASAVHAHATPSFDLKRYPYLTDDSGSHATVELATDAQFPPVVLTYGPAPACTGATTSAAGTAITVKLLKEYQFVLHLSHLVPGKEYCYAVAQSGVNLLGSDPSPTFKTALPAGDATPFSFAVIGDWGYDGSGRNEQLAALMNSIHGSGASFAVSTGDPAYNDGSQNNYGDLYQTGNNISAVFGPDYWAKNGASIPMFSGLGDHGFSSGNIFLLNWDTTDTAADSFGKDKLETYSGKDNTAPLSYPSVWYAFDWGEARFYMLSGVWGYSNLGSASQYQDDYDYHWAADAPELAWLTNDLAKHPGVPKFAFMYFPFHSDSGAQPSDPFLAGLEALLAHSSVALAFSGHSHIYERNTPQVGTLTTYVGGGGGGLLESVSGCSAFDAYALGWLAAKGRPSSCNAPVPGSQNEVNEYLLVSVSGTQVTVTPVNANGSRFDVQTYSIAPNAAPAPTHFSLGTPTAATAGSPFAATVTAQTQANSTAGSYTGYHSLRWSGLSASSGGAPTYSANPVLFNDGVATVRITPRAPETATVRVSDGRISGASAPMTIRPTGGGVAGPGGPPLVPIALAVAALLMGAGLALALSRRRRARSAR